MSLYKESNERQLKISRIYIDMTPSKIREKILKKETLFPRFRPLVQTRSLIVTYTPRHN